MLSTASVHSLAMILNVAEELHCLAEEQLFVINKLLHFFVAVCLFSEALPGICSHHMAS